MSSRNRYELNSDRVIALLNMDSFYVSVDMKDNPQYEGKPCVTVKNTNDLISVLSVNCEAKKYSIQQNMTLNEAKGLCEELNYFIVPLKYEKPYLQKYFKAFDDVMDVIIEFVAKFGNLIIIEKSFCDEVFLDFTQYCIQCESEGKSYYWKTLNDCKIVVEGVNGSFWLNENNNRYYKTQIHAAVLVSQLCALIRDRTGLISSVGISYNKLLAKIICIYNKPESISVIASKTAINRVFKDIYIEDIPGLGGQRAEEVMEKLGINFGSELRGFKRKKLIKMFGINFGKMLWNKSRGIDNIAVNYKIFNKTMSSGLDFNTNAGITLKHDLAFECCLGFCERLDYEKERHKRVPQLIAVELFPARIKYKYNAQQFNSINLKTLLNNEVFPSINQKVDGLKVMAIDFEIVGQ